jgi:hypothetical protein
VQFGRATSSLARPTTIPTETTAMKLRMMRVRSFKSIEDSGEFSVSDVTCLVGKNESGKTAILQALGKLNAIGGLSDDFTPLDYPRRKYMPSVQLPVDPPVVWTKWVLEDSEIAEINAKFANAVLASNEVEITKSYDNEVRVSPAVNEGVVV